MRWEEPQHNTEPEGRLLEQITDLDGFVPSGNAADDAIRFFAVTDSVQLKNIDRGADPVSELMWRRFWIKNDNTLENEPGLWDQWSPSQRIMQSEVEPRESDVIEAILNAAGISERDPEAYDRCIGRFRFTKEAFLHQMFH